MESKRKVRTYIVDDDQMAMTLLKKLLQDYAVEIVGTASDVGDDTLQEICELEPELLFLDVELPSGSGLDFYGKLRQELVGEVKVVFYTGYDKYMLEALRQRAFDYMLKPVSRQELTKIMMRFYEDKLSTIQTVVGRSNLQASPNVMIVNAAGEHTVLRPDDIAFFRFVSERRLWEVVTTANECYQLRHRTTAETILTYSSEFVQIHKRYIVNLPHVQKMLDNLCVLRPPLDQVGELRVSKNFRSNFLATFYNM